jgi:hypothetical protein
MHSFDLLLFSMDSGNASERAALDNGHVNDVP